MRLKWFDYTNEYADIIESWLDDETIKNTGCNNGWDNYINYWRSDAQTRWNENFFVKIVFDGEKPCSVISIGMDKCCEITVSEFIVAPEMRGKGLGTAVLAELLHNGETIIGKTILLAEAVIYPSNVVSQNIFTKAGFTFDHSHPDGDAWYYRYNRLER